MSATEDRGGTPSAPSNPLLRALHFAYYVLLDRLEWIVLGFLLFVVVGLSFTEILNRNLDWGLWDSAATNRIVFAFTFFLGLFGAALATRQMKHIRIDAVSPYLSPRAGLALEILSAVVGAIACGWLAYVAYDYIFTIIDPEERYMAEKVEWYWRVRVWKWPIVIAFGLMALHFTVGTFERVARFVGGGEIERRAP